MRVLNGNEYAIVELLAIKPLSYVPPTHLPIIKKLSKQGVVKRREGHWYLTKVGLILAGRTMH